MPICGRCNEDNPSQARFCLACGYELGMSEGQARKIVTVLFADVVDSTGLGERLDPEEVRALMDGFLGRAEAAIRSHGGVVERFIGDAVMAVFGIPQAHEDDALRAVRAAVQIQNEIARMNEERSGATIAVRVGINSGKVLAASGDGRSGVTGDPVNAAARLEKLAAPGGIVIGGATHRLVRGSISSEPLGRVEVRGKSEPLDAHVVLAVDPPSAQIHNYEAPMVGRRRELDSLKREYQRVAEDRICVLFTLLGPAGIGKSRLLSEFTRSGLDRDRVLSGRCLPYGDGITFWPVTEALTGAAHISDRDSQEDALQKLIGLIKGAEDDKLIANLAGQLIGITEQTASQEEVFWAARKVFEFLARDDPIVLIFDDVHWAESALLDFIDHVVDRCEEVPILVACLARPELFERRPTWGGGKLNATSILLEPLKEAESKELYTGLLGGSSAIDPLLPRILETSGGNPFFLEETVSMLVDEGTIEKVDGRWIARKDVGAIAIPPTIDALLISRLDQLTAAERTTIEVAAVMGKVFASQAVRDLAPEIDVASAFEELSRKGLLKLDQEELVGEEMYRFRHILIRDAAYQVIPKRRRAGLHERYADWLTESLGERSGEYDEIIGYHYEQAHRYLVTLGLSPSNSLARRAGNSLADAGRKALDRSDFSAAVNLLTRAVSFCSQDDPARTELLLELGQALWEQGDYEGCERYFEEALETALKSQDLLGQTKARLHLEEVRVHNRPQASVRDFRVAIEGSIPVLQGGNDHDGLAYAYRQLSFACDSLGDSTGAAEALTQAVKHAVAAGDERQEIAYRRAQVQSMSWGPTAIAEMEQRTREFLGWAQRGGDRRSVAMAYGILGQIEASKGNFQAARELLLRKTEIYDDLGLEIVRAWGVFEHVMVEKLAGSPAKAETELSRACEVLRRRGETAVLPTILSMLADVRVDRGSFEEAEALIAEALRAASHDDLLTKIRCDAVLAKIRASQGREEEAVALADSATEISAATDWLDWGAFTWIDRASVLRAFGRKEDARHALDSARRLFYLKGMEHAATHVEELVTELGHGH